jgi:pimeloyl-ACP methyl ester carboxylesterase
MTTQHPGAGMVIALHCSGAGASQWRQLGAMLSPRFTLHAPEHYGTATTGPWTGEHAFSLADEAARTVALIDSTDADVHLVGHSYGGGVALRVAMERSDRIASLSLYEPSAFHLLGALGADGEAARGEIVGIMRTCAEGVVTGDFRNAAATFVDYWNGAGAWNALKTEVQTGLTHWLPKAVLDFRALLTETTQLSAYRRLPFPVLIMRGENAPNPTWLIAEALSHTLMNSRLQTIAGAGHMGPLTHSGTVNAAIVAHLNSVAMQYVSAA